MTLHWTRPDPRDVDLVLVSLADPTMRTMFFSRLDNPEWLEPLRALHVFDTVPEVITGPTGSTNAPRWPEGEYLARVAANYPEIAAEIYRSHQDSTNPWVQRDILNGITTLPTPAATQLVSVVVKLVTQANAWLEVDKILTLTERMNAAGEVRLTARVLTALFAPRAGAAEEMVIGTRARLVSGVEDYHYRELLTRAVPLIVAQPGIKGLKLVVGWLRRAAEIRAGDADPDDALSRSSIAEHMQNSGGDDIADSLIVAARDVALHLGVAGHTGELVHLLDRSHLLLLRRIGLEVTAQLLARESANGARGTTAADALETTAYAMLTDIRLMELDARPEYVHLALTLVPQLAAQQLEAWVALVRSPTWQGSDEDIRRMLTWRRTEPGQASDEDVARMRTHTLQRFLQPLETVLPEGLAAELTTLQSISGPIKHPEFGIWSESHFGPTSPMTRPALAAMDGPDLLDLLRTWTPPDATGFGPTVTGLAREVEQLVIEQPAQLENVAGQFIGLGRSYVRAALDGWAKATLNGYKPSTPVWTLVHAVLQEHDDGAKTTADFDAHDKVWRYAQRAAVEVVSAHIRTGQQPLPSADAVRLLDLLRPAIDHADPTIDHETRLREQGMDPLTISLNTTRPTAIRAAIRLAAATRDAGLPDDDGLDAVIETLDAHVGVANDPSSAVAAVFGEGIGLIAGVVPDWVRRHQETLFAVLDENDDARRWADIVVSVALRSYQPTMTLLELMRPAISDILTITYAATEHTEGWRGHEPTIHAAAVLLLHVHLVGDVELNDPQMQQLFSPAVPDEIVAAAIGRIGWNLMRTQHEADRAGSASRAQRAPLPADYLARARDLIDQRVAEIDAGRANVAELAQFHWWVQSDLFDATWWLPILLRAVAHPTFELKGQLGENLAHAAESQPTLAITALSALYQRREGAWSDYHLLQHAPMVIAAAQRSTDERAIVAARELTDSLGRQGHFDLLERVDDLLGRPKRG